MADKRVKSPFAVKAGDRPQRLSSYEAIKIAIIDGDLLPGQQLVEAVLASQLSISRTPVREALHRLEQDGLAVRGPNGLTVRERTPGEILDVYDARCVLEALASEVAAERRTEHDLWNLDRLLDLGEKIDAVSSKARADSNREFHLAIWGASHNETLLDLLQRLDLHLLRYPETTLMYPGRWEESIKQHRELVSAIRARNGKRANALAAKHFRDARDIRMRLWHEHPPIET
jgi:DNA-binding GntR family transcriptional regulator